MKTNLLAEIYRILPPQDVKKGMWVVMLLVILSILDFFSFAFFIPVIFLLVNPGTIKNDTVAFLYELSGLETPQSFIIAVTLSILVFMVLKNVISISITKIKAHFAYRIGSSIANRTLWQYMSIHYHKFSQADHSRELNRIANQPMAFSNNIILPVATMISELFVCLLIVTCIALYDVKILIVIALIIGPTLFLYRIRRENLKNISNNLNYNYPLLVKYTLQIIEGLFELKAFRKENFFKKKFKMQSERVASDLVRDHVVQASTVRITEVVACLVICTLIIYAVLQQQHFQETVLMLSIYAAASFRVIPSFNRILHASAQIRSHEYLITDLKNIEKSTGTHEHQDTPVHAPFNDSIELRNISFRYSQDHPVLKNISITIHKGEKAGITGQSGEGKTTLLMILLRFLTDHEGEIVVDHKLVREHSDWGLRLGYIPQNPHLLDGTIAENVAFGIPANEIDVKKINTIVTQLDLKSMIDRLPQGLDTRIGEKGIKISGGQRQRLAIARVLYADYDILLLDEFSNHLHKSVEREIMNILDNLSRQGKTIIVVTHRITDASFFDKIYELKQGEAKEIKATINTA